MSKSKSIKPYSLNPRVVELIRTERQRQKDLLSLGNIKFDCASPIACDDRKLRTLTEELGEVARAVDRLEGRRKDTVRFVQLQEELVQVAAVSIAWLEALEKETR